MPFRRESWREFLSRTFNWLSGGSMKEYYCARIYREHLEGKNNVRKILFWNWVFFFYRREVDHCKNMYVAQTYPDWYIG